MVISIRIQPQVCCDEAPYRGVGLYWLAAPVIDIGGGWGATVVVGPAGADVVGLMLIQLAPDAVDV